MCDKYCEQILLKTVIQKDSDEKSNSKITLLGLYTTKEKL